MTATVENARLQRLSQYRAGYPAIPGKQHFGVTKMHGQIADGLTNQSRVFFCQIFTGNAAYVIGAKHVLWQVTARPCV